MANSISPKVEATGTGAVPNPITSTVVVQIMFFVLLGVIGMFLPETAFKVSGNYWGTSKNVFDGSEPNNTMAPWISEFWSASSDLPYAGVHLLWLAKTYAYDWRLVLVYIIIISMYSTACIGHITMNIPICQAAIVMVISTPIITFMFWGELMGAPFKSVPVRVAVCLGGWAILVTCIYTLPFILEPLGGLFTVFVVQSPPIVASLLGAVRVDQLHGPGSEVMRKGLNSLRLSGWLLVVAMIFLLGEVHFCANKCAIQSLWGMPWMHLIIHTLQQVAVYLFGIGSACIHYTLLDPQPCSFRWSCYIVPYLELGAKVAKD